jgi:hypothetical protein
MCLLDQDNLQNSVVAKACDKNKKLTNKILLKSTFRRSPFHSRTKIEVVNTFPYIIAVIACYKAVHPLLQPTFDLTAFRDHFPGHPGGYQAILILFPCLERFEQLVVHNLQPFKNTWL